MKPVEEMNRFELDNLEEEIRRRRLELWAIDLFRVGLNTKVINGLDFVIVFSPDLAEFTNALASPDECRHLMDFIRNLTPDEAFRRWRPTVSEKLSPQPYTKTDAARDTREARHRLQASGEKFTTEDWAAASFMDLAE